jgi:hypothetical protein
MKKTTFFIILIILFVSGTKISFSQNSENWLEKNDPISYAKLYLHTDRDIYFQGDTIWFKAYYLNGQTQVLWPGFYNLFVDIVDESGKTIHTQVLPITNGLSSGYVKIHNKLESGSYLLRALTNAQKQIGEDAYFYKTIEIFKIRNSPAPEDKKTEGQTQESDGPDISFLPEGGFLLAGQVNLVGIKAINPRGKGLTIKGKVIDSKGRVVSTFSTAYKGLGKLYLSPHVGETYRVEIEEFPDFKYEFKEVKQEGIKIEFMSDSKEGLIFRSTTNAETYKEKNYYFAIMNKGRVLFYQRFTQRKNDALIKVNPTDLLGGINRVILMDAQLKPISERLIFSNNYEINQVQIVSNQEQYQSRSRVDLGIIDEEDIGNSFSSLSLSVVDENTVVKNEPSLNILSYLLIDSELKGIVESPSDYFIDDENIFSEEKLNLLMLTQGWSNYVWNGLTSQNTSLTYLEDGGITIKGRVKRLFNQNPVTGGNVILGIIKNGSFATYEAKTDIDGRFLFKDMILTDTSSIYVQATNSKGKKVSGLFLKAIKSDTKLPPLLHRNKYNSELAMTAYDPNYKGIMLEEVIVKADRIEEDDVAFRVYPKPRVSLKPGVEAASYPDVLSYLSAGAPGARVANGEIAIRGLGSFSSSAPLFLVDGFPIFIVPADSRGRSPHPEAATSIYNIIKSIPMMDIDRIEIYKDANETAWFGMRGMHGVISIYTKQGPEDRKENPYTKGAIASTIVGYAGYREFYSPKYTVGDIDSKRPDNRVTLYWNPDIITKNGKASLSFFTSDDIANYKIFVEGITNDGRVCVGNAEFSVNEYSPKILK